MSRYTIALLALVACADHAAREITLDPATDVHACPPTHGVLLGDSIVALMYANAKDDLTATGDVVDSLATSGDTIDAQRDRWMWTITPPAVPEHHDWYFIQVGVNDLNRGRTLDQMKADYAALTGSIHVIDPTARIIAGVILPAREVFETGSFAMPDSLEQWTTFNAWLVETFGARTDIEEAFDDGDGYLLEEYDSGDGIHPNVAGDHVAARILHDLASECP